MGRRRWTTALVFSAFVVAAYLAAWAAETSSEKPPALKPLKPLKVDKSSALRLDDGPKKPLPKTDGKPRADNQSCYVCHGNYQGEELVEQHAVADISCVICHGKSIAHRNDEDHRTPPDMMYRPEQIALGCAKCHETHDAPAAKVVARWQEKCPARTNMAELVCTDCHGEHRMKFRSFWWDKTTREYIVPKPGEPRIKPGIDLTKPAH